MRRIAFYFLTAFGDGEIEISRPFSTYEECSHARDAAAKRWWDAVNSYESGAPPNPPAGFSLCYAAPPPSPLPR